MIFNNYSIDTSLYENINIGYSLNMYVSKIYIMCLNWNIWDVCIKWYYFLHKFLHIAIKYSDYDRTRNEFLSYFLLTANSIHIIYK